MAKLEIKSLNLIAWLKAWGIDVEIVNDNGYVFGLVDDTKEVADCTLAYKSNKTLHMFLKQFKELKYEIKKGRTK